MNAQLATECTHTDVAGYDVSVAACSSSVKVGPEALAGLMPDGTAKMSPVQAAFIASAGGGSETWWSCHRLSISPATHFARIACRMSAAK